MTVAGKFGIVSVFKDAILDGDAYGPITVETDFLYRVAPAVEEKPGAIGFTSYAYHAPNARPIAVDGVTANPVNVRNKTYPLSREMIIVAKETPAGKVKQFFDLMLSPEGLAIVGKKFVPIE